MRIRLDSQTGPAVPSPDKALDLIQAHLAAQQALWAEQLARAPAALAALEPQIHLAFGKLADQLVASLLAHAAGQSALAAAAKKSRIANFPEDPAIIEVEGDQQRVEPWHAHVAGRALHRPRP